MRHLLVVVGISLLSSSAIAQAPAPTAAMTKEAFDKQIKKAGPWNRKSKDEVKIRKEVMDFYAREVELLKKNDFESISARIDYPVYMVSDDSKGEAVSSRMMKEQYAATFKPFFDKMPKPTDIKYKPPTVTVLSDTLANVVVDYTMHINGQKLDGRFAGLLVRRGGGWFWKVIAQAGGDDTCGGELLDKVSNPGPLVH